MAGERCMEQLLELWQGVVKRVYHLYQLSANAYFIFLQLNDHTLVSHGSLHFLLLFLFSWWSRVWLHGL